VATDAIERTVKAFEAVGFQAERFDWSINFKGHSKVGLQLSTADFYKDFYQRAVAADVHGSLLRIASFEDTLRGKMKAWQDSSRRPSKRIKDLGDIARLIEPQPELGDSLTDDLQQQSKRPED